MNKANVDKKTVVTLISVYAVIIVVLLVIEFVPGLRFHIKTEREVTLEKYETLNDPNGYGDYIAENQELYTDQILGFYDFDDEYDEEHLHFVYDYPVHKSDHQTMRFTDDELNCDGVPELYMFDRRWGYEDMGGAMIAQNGCAVISMEMAYLALAHDDTYDPADIADIAVENDCLDIFGGIHQDKVTTLANALGINAVEFNYWQDEVKEGLEEDLKNSLDKENVVVFAAMSGETFGGHAIIIKGYDENGFYINDPASREKTDQTWSFDVMQSELVGFWEMSL